MFFAIVLDRYKTLNLCVIYGLKWSPVADSEEMLQNSLLSQQMSTLILINEKDNAGLI